MMLPAGAECSGDFECGGLCHRCYKVGGNNMAEGRVIEMPDAEVRDAIETIMKADWTEPLDYVGIPVQTLIKAAETRTVPDSWVREAVEIAKLHLAGKPHYADVFNSAIETLIKAAQETERLSKLLMDRLDENIKLRAELAALKQTTGELCQNCGWSMVIPPHGCMNCKEASTAQEATDYWRNKQDFVSHALKSPAKTEAEQLRARIAEQIKDFHDINVLLNEACCRENALKAKLEKDRPEVVTKKCAIKSIDDRLAFWEGTQHYSNEVVDIEYVLRAIQCNFPQGIRIVQDKEGG